jgi:hypothetical protein
MAERYTHFEDGGRIDGRLSSPTPPRAPAAETAGTNPSAEALAERDEFGASVVILADDLNEARAELERVTRERDEAYATVRRVWQALGCERYEDARGMHISELVEELRRDRDRYKEKLAAWKALAEAERERCARVVDTPGEFPALRWKIAAAIRSLPTPTLPEESGDRDHHKAVVEAEREAIAAEARRYASHYPQGSDGRNTFILLAEWIEARSLPTLPGREHPDA